MNGIMDFRRQQRAAVNVEYVLLMVFAALALTLGVSFLNLSISNKLLLLAGQMDEHAVAALTETTTPAATGTFAGSDTSYTDDGSGDIIIYSDNPYGSADFSLYIDGADTGERNGAAYFAIDWRYGSHSYEIRDRDGNASVPIVLIRNASVVAIWNNVSPYFTDLSFSDGASWVGHQTPSVIVDYSGGTGQGQNSVAVVGTKTMFITGTQLGKSQDGGSTWSFQPMPFNAGSSLSAVSASSDGGVWLAGQLGYIYRSTDGGATWNNKSLAGSPNTALVVTAITSVSTSTAWVVGSNGAIKKTVDGGSTWTAQTVGASTFHSVTNADSQTLWAVGAAGTIRRTSNGGSTWTAQTSGVATILRSVSAVDANTAWVVGDSGVIRKTTDGGSTWTAQSSGVTTILYDVHALDANTAWAVGASGVVLKTTNGGTTWTTDYVYTSTSIFGKVTRNLYAVAIW